MNAKKYRNIINEYRANLKLTGPYKKYINSQLAHPFSDLKFCGLSVQGHGCEIVAIYNALQYLHKWRSFPKVIRDCRIKSLQWLGGHWGISPFRIGKYFKVYKIKHSSYFSYRSMEKHMIDQKKGCGIVSYWNRPMKYGIHTVFFIYEANEEDKLSFTIYNGNSKKPLNNRFIFGYLL